MLFNKHKAGITAGILVLVTLVMFANFSNRKDYDHLDHTVASIYKDRLIPAGYLFQINHHIFEKKSSLDLKELTVGQQSSLVQINNREIEKLIHEYEQTFLTPEEKNEWLGFRAALENYNGIEQRYLDSSAEESLSALNGAFRQIELRLHQLNKIQTSEGEKLQAQSVKIIGATRFNAWFESALLFVICIALLHLTGFNEKMSKSPADRALLN